jgi:hypothetical protein
VSRISWKKTQANNPKYDPELVALKKEICELLETRRAWVASTATRNS